MMTAKHFLAETYRTDWRLWTAVCRCGVTVTARGDTDDRAIDLLEEHLEATR